MERPTADNQQFSEKTLKGFLLKNVQQGATEPRAKELNKYLIDRVDVFWDTVITKLIRQGKFNGNKMNWYFEIYKEGIESRRVIEKPFTHVTVTPENIDNITAELADKSISELCAYGVTYLSSAYTILTGWYRDGLIAQRYEELYSSPNPVDWILRAEQEEHGLMQADIGQKNPTVANLLNKIGLIMSRRT